MSYGNETLQEHSILIQLSNNTKCIDVALVVSRIFKIYASMVPKNVTTPPFLGGELKTHGLVYLG